MFVYDTNNICERGQVVRVCFIVKVMIKDDLKMAYMKELALPFVPMVGMRLQKGFDASIWEADNGKILHPSVKEIVYNIDDFSIYCLFEVKHPLVSDFWERLEEPANNHFVQQFG